MPNDYIGDNAVLYNESKELIFRKLWELPIFGALTHTYVPRGQKILDVACGSGYYTRKFLTYEPTMLVGADASQDMLMIAMRESPANIYYQNAIVGSGELRYVTQPYNFDVVSATYLLNYAKSITELGQMLSEIRSVMVPRGAFIGLNDNPFVEVYSTNEPDLQKATKINGSLVNLGLTKTYNPDAKIETDRNRLHHNPCTIEYRLSNGANFTNFYYTPDEYADAFASAGFKNLTWVTDRGFVPHELIMYSNNFDLEALPIIGFYAGI